MKKFTTIVLPAFIAPILFISLLSFSEIKNSAVLLPGWEKLGQRKVNFKVDRDEIFVGRFEGFFDALQVKVKNGPINMHRMIVNFRNGQTTEIELRNNFEAGSESRVIDLPGNNRIITTIVFWYDTKGFANSKAVLEIWGRH